jgi:hypothetical protein
VAQVNWQEVKDLAAAVSTQAQVSNRTWLALITVSVVAVLPRSSAADGTVALPLGLGSVDPASFHLVVVALLVVLIIGFAAAHAQQVRAQRLAQRAIDSLADSEDLHLGMHARDLFDAFRMPSISRIAPLAQLLKGLDSFYGTSNRVSRARRILSVAYYLALKTVSWLVYFGFPAVALWLSVWKINATGIAAFALTVIGTIATVPLVHVFAVDIAYVVQVSRTIGRDDTPPN